jgi:hypothetical protein
MKSPLTRGVGSLPAVSDPGWAVGLVTSGRIFAEYVRVCKFLWVRGLCGLVGVGDAFFGCDASLDE